VLRARLEDARFYWVNDLKGGLEAKLPLLKGIVVHEKLGTVHDRAERLVVLVEELAKKVAPRSLAAAKRAALLCKADLASEMVRSGKEFASLQGIIGGDYAAASGEPADVAEAIRRLMRNILFFAGDAALVDNVLQSACEFVERVPVQRLTFAPDSRVWGMIG
jgi:glycyl-tRNA synthetase beta chain